MNIKELLSYNICHRYTICILNIQYPIMSSFVVIACWVEGQFLTGGGFETHPRWSQTEDFQSKPLVLALPDGRHYQDRTKTVACPVRIM